MSILKGQSGVNAVEAIFLNTFGWVFRPQPVADFGIDAEVEQADFGHPNGKILKLQIKSGASYFREKKGGNYIFRGESRLLRYWLNHNVPVFVILHNPETGLIIWQKVDANRRQETKKGWAMDIPEANTLDESAKWNFENSVTSDPEAILRLIFSLDAKLMRNFIDRPAVLQWEDWVNKSLGMRNPMFILEDPTEIIEIDIMYPSHDPDDIMRRVFPWLTWELADEQEDSAAPEEVQSVTLDVQLRQEALEFLRLEKFFAEGVPERPEPDESEIEYDPDYEEWLHNSSDQE
ncbi:DUF4365 domain-containing protein [Mesorhizobium sp. M1004]|uniref:DUF4365 domain-containing protein n=1 Tax=Mesorhizobium sp. M1004 TaxID=2957046 RepID=UPI0033377562